jgi:hypothetical protein
MGKTQLIRCICSINAKACPRFLTRFSPEALQRYLEYLRSRDTAHWSRVESPMGNARPRVQAGVGV